QLRQEGDRVIGSVGGFDLEYSGERFGRDGYRYATMLLRSGYEDEVELPVTTTPIGAVARLEHALGDLEGERDGHKRRRDEARRRLASYKSRIGETFAFAADLDHKRRELADIETQLAASAGNDGLTTPDDAIAA